MPSQVSFSQSSYKVSEKGVWSGALPSVSRTGDGAGAVTVKVRVAKTTAANPATAKQDFKFATQTLTWAAGELGPKPIVVEILDDSQIEVDEVIPLELYSAKGTGIGPTGTAEIVIVSDEKPSGLTAAEAETLIKSELAKQSFGKQVAFTPTLKLLGLDEYNIGEVGLTCLYKKQVGVSCTVGNITSFYCELHVESIIPSDIHQVYLRPRIVLPIANKLPISATGSCSVEYFDDWRNRPVNSTHVCLVDSNSNLVRFEYYNSDGQLPSEPVLSYTYPADDFTPQPTIGFRAKFSISYPTV